MSAKLFYLKADTVKSLEKENMKLIEAIGDMEEATKEDKKKIRSMEENVVKEREKVLEQINKTVTEVIILYAVTCLHQKNILPNKTKHFRLCLSYKVN